ncbi:non-ribosomal peptide synthetase [Kitasatospora paracochleata]|uniref:Phenyloxazoline synthase MbtB n=1 Tax=Kitasatospora paracochleata TaxID=58354 RepID=A0ABT1IX54_9ACTN|nr:non-ribosomal peptide synthetase [Kitasatospora paracochleata]MCP2309466.1 amino acid adenylation domain-containing protein [Kitasatospora paracochleata]
MTDLSELIAELVEFEAEQIGERDNLIELGLDSLAMMRVAGHLRRTGLDIGFAELAAEPTLAAWRTLLAGRQAADPAEESAVRTEDGEPFDLALMQHAYWVGRSEGQQLGGVAAHFYNEFDGGGVEAGRLEAAVRAVLARHGMLRVRILDDGRQQIAPHSSWPGLTVHDLRDLPAEQAERRLEELRGRLSHRRLDIAAGEVFDVQLSLLPEEMRAGGTRVHVNLDMVAADALSLRVLLADLAQAYDDPAAAPPLTYSYPRYLAERAARRAEPDRASALAADREHWQRRLPELPAAPQLPLAPDHSASAATTVVRRHRWLDAEAARCLGELARRHGLTPAMALTAVFAETLGAFSAEPDLLLNLPLFDREPMNDEVPSLVGDFTSSVLLAWDGAAPGSFAERALRLQSRFHADAAHGGYSGVEVLRDASRLRGERVLAPVVHTSALGLGDLFPAAVRRTFGEACWIISQGPQVHLDAQVTELDGGLLVNWDAREAAFAPGALYAMFAAYSLLLDRLLSGPDAWSAPPSALLPDGQRQVRERVNATARQRSGARLHDGFFAHARHRPEAPALLWGTDGSRTYGELADHALRLAARLRDQGVGPGDLVAVTLPKGPDQVTAVLAVLAAGAAYLPLGVDQPALRRARIHRAAGVRLVLEDTVVPDGVAALPGPVAGGDTDLAYVIYTSGSTGEPKGVELTHAAATNTVDDLNERFAVGSSDRTLALSALDFDLSVYDIFGPLTAGGAVVCPQEQERREAAVWADLMHRHRATIVNCVPALLDMLVTAAADGPHPALRLALLGGDWVPLDLPGRVRELAPECRFVALGGTTETAVHSTVCEVHGIPDDWVSVPYGTPLSNVTCRVVDPLGRDAPDWVPGELWIGGAGVARGYRGDPERTADRFVTADGLRWYRTGDRARYRPDGTLEFLGRADHQVKVKGHRIELGEIEAALTSYPGVAQGVAVVGEDRALAAAVTTARAAQRAPDRSALAPEAASESLDLPALRAHLAERLPVAMAPERIAVLPTLPLTPNGKIDRASLRRLLGAQEFRAAEPVTAPVGEAEQRLAAAWQDILGVEGVGREHDFFALGGDSLLATRLVSRLRAEGYGTIRLAELFAHSVLADFAALLAPDVAAAPTTPVADQEHRHEPFAPTDVQRAYWLGRGEGFTLGGIGCHFYREYDLDDLDLARLEEAVNRLVLRHEMLRAVFDENGDQRILAEVPRFTIAVADAGPDPEEAFAELREQASHRVFDPSCWPLFAVGAVRSGRRTRLAIGIDNLVLDALSILIVYRELGALYTDPATELPPVGLSFRDYLRAAAPDPAALAAAEAYWTARLPELPPAPQLPLAVDPSALERLRFVRHEARLDAARWQPIADRARGYGVTPSAVLLSAFAEVLGRWSARPELTLNLTLFDRKELHPDVDNVLGDFTSLLLVASRPQPGEGRLAAARRIQQELWAALDHRDLSAVQVLRRLARSTGEAEVTMPVVFTSALGVGSEVDGPFAEHVWGVSQTPQVWLDHQVTEADGGVRLNWDVVDGLFPAGLVEEMFAAYLRLLDRLATSPWDGDAPDLLPEAQRRTRELVNDTGAGELDSLLHREFFRRAVEHPERTALVWGAGSELSYGELADRALRLATVLAEHGVRPGEPVAVTLPKGPEQIAAVLGVLAAGAAYVPVGVDQPQARRDRIHRLAGVRFAVTDEPGRAEGVRALLMADSVSAPPAAGPAEVAPEQLAYVIFTSGSTGAPKGVELSHRAAANTVTDINDRFGIGGADRVLAVSALDFDLSVYDIFGLLSAGGSLVLIEEDDRRDARRWLELVHRHGVTVWNSVPALLEMLLTVAEGTEQPLESLRLALVSGDWVPLDLPGRFAARRPGGRFIAMGGATEAAIWSNAFEVERVDPAWPSVPYGFPLRGQRFRVVDGHGRDCPDWVPGELWIGGAGVAEGYRGEAELTARQFVTVDGRRWYRTGDLGRYWPDGTLEFLGRADQQVKIRGHRIELGEIEAALQSAPGVGRAVVAVSGEGAGRRLVGAVVEAAPSAGPEEADGTPPSADVLAARDAAVRLEAEAAEAFLVRLLDLAALTGARQIGGLAARLDLAEEHLPVLRLWLAHLVERKVLLEQPDGYAPGPELPAALSRRPAAGDGYAGLVGRAHTRLLERLADYREILAGRRDATVLLDDEVLAPANLADADPGTGTALAELAAELAALAEQAGRPLEIVELDGRAGRTAERLLALLTPEQARYTLLDASPAMVAAATTRLAALPHHTACRQVDTGRLPEELRHRFDVVLAANALHRYPDAAHGPALAALLARPGGRLLAVERSALTPIALLTAGLLDGGYTGLDQARRRAGTPMLPGARWADLFAAAGLRATGHRAVGDSLTDLLWARRPQDTADPQPDALRDHAAGRLPAHMVPERIEVLPWLPLSANGKVDRAAIAALVATGTSETADQPPRGELESAVAELWSDLLGTAVTGRSRGFFELGGDSLLATRFIEQVRRRYGVELPLRRMFRAPGLAEVAETLAELLAAAEDTEEGEL